MRYASSQPAAICLAVSSSWAIASGTLAATRVVRRALAGRLALGEQGATVGDSRAGPEEGQPLVCELTRQAHRGRGERREEDRNGLLGRGSQPKRPDVLSVERQASALQQRLDSDDRGAHPIDRLLPGQSVQALDERRAARAEAEREAAFGRALQTCRGHGDRRRRATPDREHRRRQPDSRGGSGDLREQHYSIVGPTLGGAEAGIAEPLGGQREADRRLAIGLERRDAGANTRTARIVELRQISPAAAPPRSRRRPSSARLRRSGRSAGARPRCRRWRPRSRRSPSRRRRTPRPAIRWG